MQVTVTGAGGFIGSHLVNSLIEDGHEVVAVDQKTRSDWFQYNKEAENITGSDLQEYENCFEAVAVAGLEGDRVYNLAADMGGMGFIENHKADCMRSVLINTHMLEASKNAGIGRFFFSSSACVYAADKQTDADVTALKESDAYPAMAEDGYGWEKLFSERMCRHYSEDYGLETRVARFHNVYGPYTSYDGGREKAPAALCRKVIESQLNGTNTIDIWGDGEQTRSFMYIDDCVKGIKLITEGDSREPVNLGSSELVSINQLVDIIQDIAGVKVNRTYDLGAPKGVRGRNSDNTMMREIYGWEPSISLREGLEVTYSWIYDQLKGKQ